MSTNYYWHAAHVAKTTNNSVMIQGNELVHAWDDWKLVFRSIPGEVIDEYDQVIDTDEFINFIESFDTAARRNQYDWLLDNNRLNAGTDWLDAEGFSVTGVEFF